MRLILTAVIIVGLNLSSLWVYYHYSRQDREALTPSILPYGASAVPVLDRLGFQRPHSTENRWWLILYFGERSRHWAIPNLKYAQILYERFHTSGLHVVGVIAGSFPEAQRLAELGLITFPLIRDRDRAIAHALGGSPWLDACLFVDPHKKARFSTVDFFDPEDLRQLTEKFLMGKVSYPESTIEIRLREGERLPELRLLKLDDLELVSLTDVQSPPFLIIFTATCPTCRLSEYLGEYVSIEHQWGVRPLVIFSQNFSRDDILCEARSRGIDTARFYVAAEAAGEIGDPYYWSASRTAEVLVIEMNYDGTIKRIEPWEKWMARWEGGTSP